MEKEQELDYSELTRQVKKLQKHHPALFVTTLGTSILGRDIPILHLGNQKSEKRVLYVGTHHASENLCTSVLLRFVQEYLELSEQKSTLFGVFLPLLNEMRGIDVIPMLNPDGVEYRLHGLSNDNPLKERVLTYNEGKDDFSRWNANARGVDLNHNYDAFFSEYKAIEQSAKITNGPTRYSGEYPESEPEVCALCHYLRFFEEELCGVMTFHSQGEEIYYSSRGKAPKNAKEIGTILANQSGYRLAEPTGLASYGGLTDYMIHQWNKPSFTIECGLGQNPLPPEQILPIYYKNRRNLFTFPVLF